MKKSIALLNNGFESSSMLTPEFTAFHKTFKAELTKLLKAKGCTNIEVKRGHFYCSGFFTAPNGQIYYFSLSDVRSMNFYPNEQKLMYRTAKHYKDFTGGSNQWVKLADLEDIRL